MLVPAMVSRFYVFYLIISIFFAETKSPATIR